MKTVKPKKEEKLNTEAVKKELDSKEEQVKLNEPDTCHTCASLVREPTSEEFFSGVQLCDSCGEELVPLKSLRSLFDMIDYLDQRLIELERKD